MGFYEDRRAAAARVIQKYGRSVTIRRTTAGTLNTTTGVYTGGSYTDYTAYAVVMKATAGAVEAHDIRFKNETLIESNLRTLLIVAENLDIVPHPGDQVIMDSETWKIIGNTPVAPAGTYVVHRVTIERGI